MGIFSFIKDAGAKIFGIGKTEAEKAEEAKEDLEKAAKSMEEKVRDHGLEIEGLDVSIQGDTATVRGKAKNQATKEKVVLVVGNTEGIAQVDDQIEVEKKEPEARFHTVKSGDTLSKIAKEFYGDPGKYPVIFEANKPMLKDPDKIYPGQSLRIPTISD